MSPHGWDGDHPLRILHDLQVSSLGLVMTGEPLQIGYATSIGSDSGQYRLGQGYARVTLVLKRELEKSVPLESYQGGPKMTSNYGMWRTRIELLMVEMKGTAKRDVDYGLSGYQNLCGESVGRSCLEECSMDGVTLVASGGSR